MKDETIEQLLIIYGIINNDMYNNIITEIVESKKSQNFTNIENNSIEQKRLIILYLHYSSRIIENCLVKYDIMNSIDKPPMLKEPEKCIMCTLHFKLRVGELLMTSLSTDIILFISTIKKQNIIFKSLEQFFNKVFANIPKDDNNTTSNVNFNINKTEGKNTVENISMTGKRQDKVMNNYIDMIECVYEQLNDKVIKGVNMNNRKKVIIEIFQLYVEIIKMLKINDDFNGEMADILQDKLDMFSLLFISTYGIHKITNYMHLAMSGHIRFWLLKY
jgi:hypothetical protein